MGFEPIQLKHKLSLEIRHTAMVVGPSHPTDSVSVGKRAHHRVQPVVLAAGHSPLHVQPCRSRVNQTAPTMDLPLAAWYMGVSASFEDLHRSQQRCQAQTGYHQRRWATSLLNNRADRTIRADPSTRKRLSLGRNCVLCRCLPQLVAIW